MSCHAWLLMSGGQFSGKPVIRDRSYVRPVHETPVTMLGVMADVYMHGQTDRQTEKTGFFLNKIKKAKKMGREREKKALSDVRWQAREVSETLLPKKTRHCEERRTMLLPTQASIDYARIPKRHQGCSFQEQDHHSSRKMFSANFRQSFFKGHDISVSGAALCFLHLLSPQGRH